MIKNTPVGYLVVDALIRCDALKINPETPFRLKSGRLSPVYFDCRRLISDPAAMSLITGLFHTYVVRKDAYVPEGCIQLETPQPPVIAGGESAGIPFAVRLAAAMGRPSVYVRKAQKEYGAKGTVEGGSVADRRVILVEDLITDGGSKMAFIDALREARADVKLCLVVFDRQQGGEQSLKEQGVELVSLANIDSLVESGLAPPDVIGYFDNPDEWERKFKETHKET